MVDVALLSCFMPRSAIRISNAKICHGGRVLPPDVKVKRELQATEHTTQDLQRFSWPSNIDVLRSRRVFLSIHFGTCRVSVYSGFFVFSSLSCRRAMDRLADSIHSPSGTPAISVAALDSVRLSIVPFRA